VPYSRPSMRISSSACQTYVAMKALKPSCSTVRPISFRCVRESNALAT